MLFVWRCTIWYDISFLGFGWRTKFEIPQTNWSTWEEILLCGHETGKSLITHWDNNRGIQEKTSRTNAWDCFQTLVREWGSKIYVWISYFPFQSTSAHIQCALCVCVMFRWCWTCSENPGTLGIVPSIINPIYPLHSGYLLGIYPLLKGSVGG